MDKKKPLFLRRDWNKKSKLGRKRKNKQVWRKPKGRHNKMREKLKGKSKQPSIGYGSDGEIRGKIQGLKPVIINNVQELMDAGHHKNLAVFISRNVGILKKMNILKKALEMKIKIMNIDAEKFLKNIEEIKEEKKKKHEIRENKKKEESKKDQKGENKKKEEKEVKEINVKTEGKIAEEKKEEAKEEINLMKKEIHKHVKEESKEKKEQKDHMVRQILEK